jgi:hypothetical protein
VPANEKLFTGEYKPPPPSEGGKFVIHRPPLPGGYKSSPLVFSIEELTALVEEGTRLLEEYASGGFD